MRVLLLILLLTVPVACAQVQPDVALRYPPQTVFTNADTGETWNEQIVRAAAGQTLHVAFEIRVLRGSLSESRSVEVVWALDGEEVVREPRVLTPNGTVRSTLTWVVPDLEPGEYTMRLHLETGDWEADPSNNDPPATRLRIGEGSGPTSDVVQRPYMGAFIFLGLAAVVVPFRWPAVRHRAMQITQPVRQGLDAWWMTWPHRSRQYRDRVVVFAVAGTAILLMGTFIWRAGRLALATDAWSVLFLTALASATAAAFTRRLDSTLRTAIITFLIAALWQQAAITVPFLRWPDLWGLTPFIVNGLTVGGMYALIALGYTMVYGVLKFINFAHGDVFVWGGYLAWFVVVQYPLVGIPLALLWSIVATASLGAIIERVAYRPLRGGDRLAPLITAIAVSLLLAAMAQFFFSTKNRTFTEAGSTYAGSDLQVFFSKTVSIGAIHLTALDITILATAAVLMLLVQWGIRATRTGQAIRAVSDDMEAARIVGIPVDRVITITFVVGSALAAVGGVFWGLRFSLRPTLGLLTGIKAFTAAVVGGIGNIPGAFLGGFLIGLAENVGGQFIDSRFQNVIAFLILVIFLLVRPQGMFGKEADRR